MRFTHKKHRPKHMCVHTGRARSVDCAPPRTMGVCACFAWCDAAQIEAFLDGLPVIHSMASPWGRLLASVYHSDNLSLPVHLASTFGAFRFPINGMPGGEFDVTCPLSTQTCGSEARCRLWTARSLPNLTPPAKRPGLLSPPLAPWPWNESLRRQYGAWRSKHKVQLVGSARVKIEFGLGRRWPYVLLWRSALRPVPAANHTWVEAYRLRHPNSEGVHYGCWFYPLLAPYSRGTGAFVNVGRTLVLERRGIAYSRFRKAFFYDAEKRSGPKAYVVHKGQRVYGKDDFLWALVAHAAGYDSVQILRGPFDMPELLLSSDECISQPRPIRTCAPAGLGMRAGEGASLPCRCKEGPEMLVCEAPELPA
jgi:hypothetical protein